MPQSACAASLSGRDTLDTFCRAVREGVIIAMLLAVAIMVLKPLVFDKVHPDRVLLSHSPGVLPGAKSALP